MKKSQKKLSLRTETLRTLSPDELAESVGGTLVQSQMVVIRQLTVAGCPSYDPLCGGGTILTVRTIYIRY